MNRRLPDQNSEHRRLSASVNKLNQSLRLVAQHDQRIALLERNRAETQSKLDALKALPDYALNKNQVRHSASFADSLGALDGSIIEEQRRRQSSLDSLASLVATCREQYADLLRPRIEYHAALLCGALQPYYRSESHCMTIAMRSDALLYVVAHCPLTPLEGRTDISAARWLSARCQHLLSAPDAIPWPKPPALPSPSDATEGILPGPAKGKRRTAEDPLTAAPAKTESIEITAANAE
jgi:hypothetical protein